MALRRVRPPHATEGVARAERGDSPPPAGGSCLAGGQAEQPLPTPEAFPRSRRRPWPRQQLAVRPSDVEALQRGVSRQIPASLSLRRRGIDEVERFAALLAGIMPDLDRAERAGAVKIDRQRGFGRTTAWIFVGWSEGVLGHMPFRGGSGLRIGPAAIRRRDRRGLRRTINGYGRDGLREHSAYSRSEG